MHSKHNIMFWINKCLEKNVNISLLWRLYYYSLLTELLTYHSMMITFCMNILYICPPHTIRNILVHLWFTVHAIFKMFHIACVCVRVFIVISVYKCHTVASQAILYIHTYKCVIYVLHTNFSE